LRTLAFLSLALLAFALTASAAAKKPKLVCAVTAPCSGVPQPPREVCRPARTDGCAETAPAQGSKCSKVGRSCTYGDCGTLTYTCGSNRRWVVTGGTAPPPSPPPAANWKTCPAGQRFGCRARSQGIAPARGETIPEVCGCIPDCDGLQLIAFQLDERWPDGSRKGNFVCSASGLPSAAPARQPF
jgi:hypothetical protein